MSTVHILYRARFGNHLFQYVCARLFAERNGLRLITPFTHPHLVRMAPHDGDHWATPPATPEVRLDDGHNVLDTQWPSQRRYVLDGWFQVSEWYHRARKEIDSFAFPEPAIPEVNRKDIVANMRLGKGYRDMGWVIHPSWYLEVLSRERFERLHIVTDDPVPEYLAHFAKYDPVVVSSGREGDWKYLRSFERIVCSNSTFGWWAAFFSQASRIYTFKPWNRAPGVRLGPFPNGIEVDGRLLGE